MAERTGRQLKEGLGAGVVAGVLFGIMEMAASALMGQPPLMPIRMFASTVLGQVALEATPLGTAVIVGTIAHLALSGLFGVIYAVLSGLLPPAAEIRTGQQGLLGLLFGIALWFVNFQIIARLFYPWFLDAPQFLQAMMHAVFFGLPVALLYVGAERRWRRPTGAVRAT